jgi:nicotinamidase-related amidase
MDGDHINGRDLHGSAPERSSTALLLIDVINDLEFPGGEALFRHAERAAPKIAQLKARARAAGIPAIYVNDNFGKWRSDFRRLVAHCVDQNCRGSAVVAQLIPDEQDYFVLKPKHSGFYASALNILLKHLGVRHLILTGFATDNCVLFTANDAYLRDYRLSIPSDCVAAESTKAHARALEQMEQVLKADLTRSDHMDVGASEAKNVKRNLDQKQEMHDET